MSNRLKVSLVVILMILSLSTWSYAKADDNVQVPVKAELPVIFVSAWDGKGYGITEAICKLCMLPYDWSDKPTLDQLASGVGLPAYDPDNPGMRPIEIESRSEVEIGTPYKTIAFVMEGGPMSLDSYITTEMELKRVQDSICWAKENGLNVIGIYAGIQSSKSIWETYGEIIDLLISQCDLIIAIQPGDYSEDLINMGKESSVPVIVAEKVVSLIAAFQNLFGTGATLDN